jgi:murein DD-endopeptidase MepM/ murein hydrolase activator NlpD
MKASFVLSFFGVALLSACTGRSVGTPSSDVMFSGGSEAACTTKAIFDCTTALGGVTCFKRCDLEASDKFCAMDALNKCLDFNGGAKCYQKHCGDSSSPSGVSSSGFSWPTLGRQIRNDSAGSGYYGAPRMRAGHQGIDIVASVGEPIFATRGGTIVDPSYEMSYGNVLDVQHSSGYLSRYAHLMSFTYSHGTYVERGAKIATSGRTGNAIGSDVTPHLHFEIRQYGPTLNPLNLLP